MVRRRETGGSRLLTIMFTDIEGSTALTQRLGDERAQQLLRVHNQLARTEIARWGGREIKHTGDGVMATFGSASSAVAAATALQRASREHNNAHPDSSVVINVGLNAGEPVSEDADVFGSAVQMAARACAAAEGGQVLVTNVVRELVQGKGVLFGDQGLADLKGFDEPVRLFDVSGVESEWAASVGRERGRRGLAVGAGIAALVAVVGLVAIVIATRGPERSEAEANVSADPGNATATDVTYHRYTLNGSTEVVSVTGDCAAEDTRVVGVLDQQARGGLVGVVSTEYAATIEVARDCEGMHIEATARYDVNDGTFISRNQGFSIQTLGDDVTNSRFSSTIALGFVDYGTGAHEGATGFNICRSDTLRNEAELTNTSDCEAWYHPADRRPTLIVAAIADSEEVSTRMVAGSPANRLRYLVAVKNTSDRSVDGSVLSLAVSEGAEVRAVAPEGVGVVADLSWELGSFAPGDERWLELLVEVNRAEEVDLVLTPEVTVAGDMTVGWPATVRVRD